MAKRRRGRTAAQLLLAVLLLTGFARYENDTLQFSRFTAASALLPQSFRGFRLAVLSDLHGKEFGAYNTELVRRLADEKPDLIAICGDLCGRGDDPGRLRPMLLGLAKIAPVYYVTGNHEWSMTPADRRALFSLLDGCGVTRLRNEYRLLEKDGQTLVLAGADDPNGPADQKTPAALVSEIRADCGKDAYVLMLSHRNDQLELWSRLGVQLVLSGHAHGGVIRLPYLGGVFGTRGELFPEYDAGLYEDRGTELLVSRGLGQTRWLPFRFLNRPEIPVVTLDTPQL